MRFSAPSCFLCLSLLTMSSVPIGIVPTASAPPPASTGPPDSLKDPDVLDALLAGSANVTVTATAALPAIIVPHPLEGIESVEAAAKVIGKMLVADRELKGVRVYPRSILRQQHVAAFMLVNPFATTTEICAFFGIGPNALANIAKSDTFRALISAHRISIETSLGADLQEQLRQTLAVSLEVVQKSVTQTQDPEFALAVLDKTANRLGMGAKHNTNVQINNNIVTAEMIAAARARRITGAN